jgi:hypothetical protein
MDGKEWDRIRRTPEAVDLREAAVAWVSRADGSTISDMRLMTAAVALGAKLAREEANADWNKLRAATRIQLYRALREHGECSGDWRGRDSLEDAAKLAVRILKRAER